MVGDLEPAVQSWVRSGGKEKSKNQGLVRRTARACGYRQASRGDPPRASAQGAERWGVELEYSELRMSGRY